MISKINLRKNKELPKLASVFMDQAFMSVTTLQTSIVLARTYDIIDYADLVLLFTITLFTLGFQSSIISKPYAINQNDFEEQNQNSYFQFNIKLKLIFTLGIILIFPLFYYLSFDIWDIQRVFIFLLYIISYTFYFFVRETLLSERKTKENLKYGAVCAAGLFVLLLLIFFQNNKNINFFLVTASIIYLLLSLFYLAANYKKIKTEKIDYLKFWKANWEIGKWLLGSNFLFHLSTSIYPWMLLYITTKNNIAIFGVLISVANLVNPIVMALSSYLLPLFVRVNNDYDKIKMHVKKWSYLFGLMAFLLVLFGYFYGQDLIVLLFSEKYANLGLLVFYPFIIQAIKILPQPMFIALNAIKRTDIGFWVLIPRSILSITLGYILIKQFGLVGAFYTMIVENLFHQLLYYMVYFRLIYKKSL